MKNLTEKIRQFNDERNWGQFHSPKNLAIGLNIETSELLEIFLWLTEEESNNLTKEQIGRAKEEVGDITIYLLNLCNKLGLDPIECAVAKLEKNKTKYPIEKSFGSAKKYTNL